MWHHLAMGRLLLLFVALPAIELALLIELGSRLGVLHTLGLIALTGVVGASLARSQGLSLIRDVQERLAAGEVPAEHLVDGVLILVAGAMLLTPGVLTDAAGFALLTPSVRRWVKRVLRHRFERAIEAGSVHVSFGDSFEPGRPGPDFRVDDSRARPLDETDPAAGPVYDLPPEDVRDGGFEERPKPPRSSS